MDLAALRKSPVGVLTPISGQDQRCGEFDYFAFLPNPLPATVPLGEPTIGAIADAAMSLGRLDVAATNLPNPNLLVRPVLTKEAISTSAMEGTFAPLTEVLEGEVVGRTAVSAEAREVLNYVEAAQRGLTLLKDRPLSFNLLAELQSILVRGTRGDSFDAGQIRQRQVLIGSPNAPIDQARFVPPPPGNDLRESVSDWEKWIHAENEIHLLVKVAMGHYQFEALHPFSDGNGRLGRLLVTLQLIEGGALKYPLLNISEWLEPRKDEYFEHLLQLSVHGDFDTWVGYFCLALREQAVVAAERISRLLHLSSSLESRVRSAGSRGGTAFLVAKELIGFPILDVSFVAKAHRVTYHSAREAVLRLVDLGILREIRRGRRRLFVSDDVLRELER